MTSRWQGLAGATQKMLERAPEEDSFVTRPDPASSDTTPAAHRAAMLKCFAADMWEISRGDPALCIKTRRDIEMAISDLEHVLRADDAARRN
jgi:hypothetical protein